MKKLYEINPDLRGYATDPRTRRYLSPRRIVLTRGGAKDAENLIGKKPCQITLGGGDDLCTLSNGGAGSERAAVLLDYGTEICGSCRVMVHGITGDGDYVVASESCALDAVGAKFIRDLEPGEILVVDKAGVRSIRDHCGTEKRTMCVFEYIYFARPDSVVDGASVHEARVRAGEFLAKSSPVDADIVIGVPDSGLDAAIGFSRQSGIPYGIGFIKNKYIGRTFISPGQKSREDKVRIKLNPIAGVVRGKRVVLIDDSIVRGTTSARIVRLIREAGATEVHFRVSAPPFRNPCFYGTDIDSRENLIANNHTIDEIASIIGADTLGYLRMEDVVRLAGDDDAGFCTACFSGEYPTAVPSQTRKNRFEQKISESEGKA